MEFGLRGRSLNLLGGAINPLDVKQQDLARGFGGMSQVSSSSIATGAGFSVRCFWSASGKLLCREERGPLGQAVWTYSFDERGHLVKAHKDGIVAERYVYDEAGKRIADHLFWQGKERQFIYYYDGTLIRLDDEYLAWTEKGQLKSIYDRNRCCEYVYGTDTRLDSVLLASGKVIDYDYGEELMPVRVSEDGVIVVAYEWEDILRLTRCVDIRNELTYTFFYGDARAPQAVTISGKPDAVRRATNIYTEHLILHVGVDQVDSIRVLGTPDGRPVKCLEYDSFGNVTRDTRPALRFPLGFACGLNDYYTGFVRFGFRDYHPLMGRFTAKDPIGCTGGDNDLWDYCVDDPVACFDPTGLWTKETFSEAKVSRNHEGKFSSGRTSLSPQKGSDIIDSIIDENQTPYWREALGVYRDSLPGVYNAHPVIYTVFSAAPHPISGLLTGLIPDEPLLPWWSGLGAAPHQFGTNKLEVYGDPETGEASSWKLYEWTGSSGWRAIPSEHEASRAKGFGDVFRKYVTRER